MEKLLSNSYLPRGESIEEIQRELLRIWQNIFRKQQLGLDDHFFNSVVIRSMR